MDWIVHLLFESPLQLLAALLLLEAVLATFWWVRPGPTTFGLIVGGLILGAVLLIVQRLVVTDRERIQQVLEKLAAAVDAEDVGAIEPAIDEAYSADGMDKQRLLDRLEEAFRHAKIDDVRLIDTRIKVEGDKAQARLRAHARVRSQELPYDYYLSSWSVRWVRRGSEWRVLSAQRLGDNSVTARDLLDAVTH